MIDDLRKNGSGYYDETAYKAIKNTMKNPTGGGYTMNKGEFLEKDIVTVECTNGAQDFLLLKCHEDYATALLLRDKKYKENNIKVIGRSVMYADAGRPAYVYYDKISGYVKTIKDQEFTDIQASIAKAMGLVIDRETAPAPEYVPQGSESTVPEELEMLCKQVANCCKKLDDMQPEVPQENVEKLKTSIIRLEAERDVYKELFMMANGAKGDNDGSENKSEK